MIIDLNLIIVPFLTSIYWVQCIFIRTDKKQFVLMQLDKLYLEKRTKEILRLKNRYI